MTAHPRAGGENPWAFSFRPITIGSSPRGRGKQKADAEALKQFRLIPARAGKTGQVLHVSLTIRAHPRMGGENLGEQTYNAIKADSPPHGRGKRCWRVTPLA